MLEMQGKCTTQRKVRYFNTALAEILTFAVPKPMQIRASNVGIGWTNTLVGWKNTPVLCLGGPRDVAVNRKN
jgi:hypothetical protein